MRTGLLGLALVGTLSTVVGCGEEEANLLNGATGGTGTGDAGVDGAGEGGASGGDTGGVTAGDATSGGSDGGSTQVDDECGAITETADVQRAPADIVIAIDTSGSMDHEFCQVGMNLSAFADGVGPETRVTTIYEVGGSDWASTVGGIFGIDVDQFLGGCGGEDPFANTALAADASRYLHVAENVDSHNALEQLLSHYDAYSGFLRPDSPTHFVVVTDDTSSIPGAQFRTQMEANLNRDFYFHAIAFTGDNMGNGQCSGDTGQEYLDLATATGGEQLSICATDWSQLFAELEAAVEASSPLPCSFDIPELPAGQTFSPSEVSVSYTAPGASERVFPKAQTLDSCGDEVGWHFDDEANPTQIVFCPAACELVGDGGELGIAFGCEPPMLL